MDACIYCLAPVVDDRKDSFSVPVCGTIQRLDTNRTSACLYIEKLRRLTEDFDTAVMGVLGGMALGGTHLSVARGFANDCRAAYTELGEYTLPELTRWTPEATDGTVLDLTQEG